MTDPTAASPTTIEHDLPCIGCRYNLRTRLVSARCPECGLPVADSLAFKEDLRLYLRRPARIAKAAALLAVVTLWYVAATLFMDLLTRWLGGVLPADATANILGCIVVAGYLTEMVLACVAIGLLWSAAPLGVWRGVVRAVLVVAALGLALTDLRQIADTATLLLTPGPAPEGAEYAHELVGIVHSFVNLLLLAVLWFYFAGIAGICRSRRFLVVTHVYFLLALAQRAMEAYLSILVAFLWTTGRMSLPASSELSGASPYVDGFLIASSAAGVGYWIWVVVVMRRVKRALRSPTTAVPR